MHVIPPSHRSTAYTDAKVIVRVYANGTVDTSTFSVGMLAGAK